MSILRDHSPSPASLCATQAVAVVSLVPFFGRLLVPLFDTLLGFPRHALLDSLLDLPLDSRLASC